MKKSRKKAVFFVLILISVFLFRFDTFAAETKVLNINWSHITAVGKQASGSQSCACFALAYARTILDGKVHTWNEYNVGGNSQNTALASPTLANYEPGAQGTQYEVFRDAYNSIKAGRPFIVRVYGTTIRKTSEHWITLVGYKNVTSLDSLGPNNFFMIDPGWGSTTSVENMGECGYKLLYNGACYSSYWTSKGGVGGTSSVTTPDQAPVGYLDVATGNTNSIYVKGWAYDPDSTGSSLCIHIYVDGKHVATTTANKLREDVHNSRGCGKYHGYEATFDYKVSSTGTHTVETYALNTNTSGVNTRLTNSPKKVTVTADTTKPVVSNVKVETDSKGYTITCDVSDNVAIDRVQCPTWTLANGQDDLDSKWQTSKLSQATIKNGKATFRVNISDHNNEYGQYVTDIYAYDKAGNSIYVRKGVTLTKPCDHSYERTAIVKATLTKNGKKEYKCSICGQEKSETIYKASTIKLSTTSYTYNGEIKSPKLTAKDSEGNTISSSNYTVTKPSGRKNVGKYTYKVKFKGEYSGTKELTITIKPKKTSISKLTKAKKAFTVKWKKQSSQVTGYQIKYSTSKSFEEKYTKSKTISSYKTTSKKITGLKAKKTYYVKIRTYKTVKVNGKSTKIYSSWSNVEKVTTK